MKQEKRRFFRVDVSLPLYVLSLPQSGVGSENLKQSILPEQHMQQFEQAAAALRVLFTDERHIANGAVALFDEFNQRIDFMAWLLTQLIEKKSPKAHPEFLTRLYQDREIVAPQSGRASRVFPLIEALHQRIDQLVESLLSLIDRDLEGETVFYAESDFPLFSGEDYLHNLSVLASQGNWLSQVLTHLISKLNVYELAYHNLKKVSPVIPMPQNWPVQSVDLSRGGMAFDSSSHFKLHQKVCILMEIEGRVLLVYAQVVYVNSPTSDPLQNLSVQDESQRVAFQFEGLSEEDAASITRFVTAQELALAHPSQK
ncbi:MAG: PilZ domain-containing protein [Thiomicrorhabdus chilensis]|uniref:PilZ domain-containing protein n=1 Tax=Thiomicrorhabdus chilensis TaxID=63656 RepID=UPI00299CEFF2|nr:PilZ domain-containing protein [Thiomicrorhabdus chilensis]MDX1346828.1 PilZ domain-containing protein [Thiomicrorhabdus chilensis]